MTVDATYRLGVDVGGTFTDLLLLDETSGATYRTKVPSTPADPSQAILAGVDRICSDAQISPRDIVRVMHGTTVATNTVLEAKGARVGLVVTQGYGQILQIARSLVPGGLAGWIVWPKPEPLVDLEHTVEALERLDPDGGVVRPLDEDDIRRKLQGLAEAGVEALTIALINAYANPDHEQRIAAIAREVMPDVPLSLSSEVLPEIREYERTLSTVVNAYVSPAVTRYLRNLETEVRQRGITGDLLVLRSDGGLAPVEQAARAPVSLLLSGPAGGVTGALWAARLAGFGNVLTLDMGGTSTDVALIQDYVPRISRETEVGDLTVRAPSVDVRTVGAGGGSIAHVPRLTKALRVGPESAGAAPGPAAYGLGGREATVSDANVVLGYLPETLLGGEMPLDVDAAHRAVAEIGAALGLSTEQAAEGIVDIVNEAMYGALRLVSVRQGFDPREFALVAFGGAGPLHGNALGRLLGSWPVIVPPSPGVLNAYGDATTQLRNETSRTFIRPLSSTSAEEVRQILGDLAAESSAALEDFGVPASDRSVVLQVDMRYAGQGFELTIDLDEAQLRDLRFEALTATFDREHAKLFGFDLDIEHEIVNLRATVQGGQDTAPPARLRRGGEDARDARTERTSMWIDGARVEGWFYDRARLLAGNVVPGPAVVTEMDSTTVVLPGHAATVDEHGNLLIRPVT